MTLHLYNTETRTKQVVKPVSGSKLRMYTCGPTIYDYAHIGNFRTYVVEDLLRRSLKFFGCAVEQVMNITDIDDKTIRGALAKKIPLREYTEPFRLAFFEDLEKLNIEKVEHYPEATAYIPQMIQLIEKLLAKGTAYKSPNGSIYFSIRKFPKYGRLSHLELSELKPNASGENEADEYTKDNIADFVLWKAHDPERDGPLFWESPFGPGRPGWHIECSAMAMALLGDTLDLHCGGVDNMFPHHENEIAQSECCSGHVFARHWLHVEHLLVDHKKMSKSLGNFYTLRNLLDRGYTGSEVRYLLVSTHYRTQLNFTFAGLDGARAALTRIRDAVQRLREVAGTAAPESSELLRKAEGAFSEHLGDDLNISAALAVLFDLLRDLNGLIDSKRLSAAEAAGALALFARWDRVLGVLPLQQTEAPAHLLALLAEREAARKAKDWKRSDTLRDELLAAGYVVEDTPQGARLKKR